jgi:hypothetical protein
VAGGWRELHNFCALTSAMKLTESGTLILAGYVAHMRLREREKYTKNVRRRTCVRDADWEVEVYSG